MAGPYDYTIQPAASPFASVMQGVQAGAGMRQMNDARAQAEAQKQAEAQMHADLAEASRDISKLPGVMVRYPQLAEKLKHGWDVMNADQQQSTLQHGGEVLSALSIGRGDVAAQILRQRSEALKASGDEQGAKLHEAMAQAAESTPDMLKQATAYRLAAVPGGDKVIEGIAKLGGERRADELQPSKVKESSAKAATAESESTTKAVEAKYAEQMSVAELKKKAADIGLTGAQTNQAIALTRKYNAETQQAVLSLAGGGALGSPEKVFEAEQKLRKEYTALTGDYTQVAEGYRKVKAARDDAIGDVSLVYGYMKMLDPGSVVREGEYATAQNAAGIPERVMNLYNRAVKGERLTPNQRASMAAQAGETFKAAEKREQEARGGLEKVAKTYKLNPDNIFSARAQESTAPAAPAAPARVSSDAEYNALPSGATFIAPDGTTRRKP